MKYTKEVEYGEPLAGIPTTYTYKSETGMVIVQQEMKNIVTGTFTNKVRVTYPGLKEHRSTMTLLKRFLEAGEQVSQL